jgi:hypothetical protein
LGLDLSGNPRWDFLEESGQPVRQASYRLGKEEAQSGFFLSQSRPNVHFAEVREVARRQ